MSFLTKSKRRKESKRKTTKDNLKLSREIIGENEEDYLDFQNHLRKIDNLSPLTPLEEKEIFQKRVELKIKYGKTKERLEVMEE